MSPRAYDGASTVEDIELRRSGRKASYPPTEKIRIIEVDNFPVLGKLTAFRFIEWVLRNPDGVISLPTGKTPEFFIKWVKRILERWNTREIQALLGEYKIEGGKRPAMKDLSFVQIDEFYPMDARQHNSFNYYVREFYIKGFGMSKDKALLIDATSLGIPKGKTAREIFPGYAVDLSLRVRQTRTELERMQRDAINQVDAFCTEYETKIREMGGIGFFLGGIGPDGHIAFNVRGSSSFSVTRLTGTNYETQAAAATDLGGIEISRGRLVITIGLATVTFNSSCTAIILAAGEAKASVVRQAVEEEENPQYPASVLHRLPSARFYLTKGGASRLVERRMEDFCALKSVDDEHADDIVIALALSVRKSLSELTAEDFKHDRFARELSKKTGLSHKALSEGARNRMVAKLEKGLRSIPGTRFLHTEPHHDDIMLGYLPYLYHLVRDPSAHHYFANLTSGFTAVSNQYFLDIVQKLEHYLAQQEVSGLLAHGYFDPSDHAKRMEDVYLFLDGTAARTKEWEDEAEARRMLRNVIESYTSTDLKFLQQRVREMVEYLQSQYPGAKDPPDVQTLKGMIREYEVELLWAHFGIEGSSIFPLRLGFYQGDIFSEEPEMTRDVQPILALLRKLRPNVVSVAFDPEGSGPDTHYKVLQAVAEAVKIHEQETGDSSMRIWGYRNVWYRFKPAEADVLIPVSLNTLSLLHTSFMNCFGSQSAASFPSYEHDGPFSELAQKIMVEQYGIVKTCLGKDFFLRHSHPRLRAARGMIFLKEMSLEYFYRKVRELKKLTEARE